MEIRKEDKNDRMILYPKDTAFLMASYPNKILDKLTANVLPM